MTELSTFFLSDFFLELGIFLFLLRGVFEVGIPEFVESLFKTDLRWSTWFSSEITLFSNSLVTFLTAALTKNEELVKENKKLKQQGISLTNQLNYLQKNMDKIIERKVNAAVKNVTNEFENKVISLEN